MTLKRKGATPLYYQLEEILSNQIDSGQLEPGQLIPTEEQLQKQYSISRITVRQAISRLVTGGKLHRVPGRGTFVTEPRTLEIAPHIISITEEVVAKNMTPRTEVLECRVIPAPAKLTKILGVAEGDPVVRLEQVKYGNEEAIAWCDSYLPERLVPGLKSMELLSGSVYKTLEKEYGHRLAAADVVLDITLATPRISDLLGIAPEAPVLVVLRTTYLSDGQAIEYSKLVFAGGRFRYRMMVHGRRSEADD